MALNCQIPVVGLEMVEDIESQMRFHQLQVDSNQGITMRGLRSVGLVRHWDSLRDAPGAAELQIELGEGKTQPTF
ncbi:hypothetical protein TURU_062511 [Turdus rufiventris]|nr:hypothetical protein TURU_062511 [Turdus rufiventris]